MPKARHTTWMLLSLAFLIAGCGGGGDAAASPARSAAAPPATAGTAAPPPAPPAPTSGLDARPSNTTCIAPERATGSVTIGTQRAFPNLSSWTGDSYDAKPALDAARATRFEPLVRREQHRQRACLRQRRERFNLLGLPRHRPARRVHVRRMRPARDGISPRFSCDSARISDVHQHATHGRGPDTHLSEFTSPDGGLTLNPDSERVIIKINKPGANHHGGHIAFGRDGYLYMSTGEGNSAQTDFAQRMNSLLGKMIRIDIRGTTGNALYRIPPDNPFAASTALCNVNGTGRPELSRDLRMGLRNPWRWSFDRETGDIWLGDVGETTREEVNRIVRGGNYGWRCFEGTQRTQRPDAAKSR